MGLLDVFRGRGISLLGQPVLDRRIGNPFKFSASLLSLETQRPPRSSKWTKVKN